MNKKKILSLAAILFGMGLTSCAQSPYIGENGNWWVGDSDLGIPATGPAGSDGTPGKDGVDGQNGSDGAPGKDGADGQNGSNGKGIVSIQKVGSAGNVDTYEITFSDGTKQQFNVTNGESVTVTDVRLVQSVNGVDTYEITFSCGFKTTFEVKNGKDLTIKDISKVSSNGRFDTYRITFSDGTHKDYVVANGATPIIGENGNWWIDGVDTGVLADPKREDKRVLTLENKISNGMLQYRLATIGKETGYVVQGLNQQLGKQMSTLYYPSEAPDMTPTEYDAYVNRVLENPKIVIPNLIGNVPVFGIDPQVFSQSRLKSISLSNRTSYLGDSVFAQTPYLESFDFNDAPLAYLPKNCFAGSGLKRLSLTASIKTLKQSCFAGCPIENLNVGHVTHFETGCLNGARFDYVWLSKDVRHVGAQAFVDTSLYIEAGADTTKWAELSTLTSTTQNYVRFAKVYTDCKQTNDVIYRQESTYAVGLRSTANAETIVIPAELDKLPLKRLETGFIMEDIVSGKRSTIAGQTASTKTRKVEIPSSVTRLEHHAVYLKDAVICVPSSVTEMVPALELSYDRKSFYAFESPIFPTFYQVQKDYQGKDVALDRATVQTAVDQGWRYALSSKPNEFSYSSAYDLLYRERALSVEIIDGTNVKASYVIFPDTINNKKVTKIGSSAYRDYADAKGVAVGKHVEEIAAYAFAGLGNYGPSVFLPALTTTIRKSAFAGECIIFSGAPLRPEGWDTQATGSYVNVFFGKGLIGGEILSDGKWLYHRDGNDATLLKDLSLYRCACRFIPSEIGGAKVSRIHSYFSHGAASSGYFVPFSVILADENSFTNSAIYFESSARPTGFHANYNGHASEYFNNQGPKLDSATEMKYAVLANYVYLVAFEGEKSHIRIPRMIAGKPVDGVFGGFYKSAHATRIDLPDRISYDESSFVNEGFEEWELNFERYSKTCYYHGPSGNTSGYVRVNTYVTLDY